MPWRGKDKSIDAEFLQGGFLGDFPVHGTGGEPKGILEVFVSEEARQPMNGRYPGGNDDNSFFQQMTLRLMGQDLGLCQCFDGKAASHVVEMDMGGDD